MYVLRAVLFLGISALLVWMIWKQRTCEIKTGLSGNACTPQMPTFWIIALFVVINLPWAYFVAGHILEKKWDRYGLSQLDREAVNNPQQSTLIVTLTTSPSRLLTVDNTLKSWLKQTVAPAQIIVYLPALYRDRVEYAIPKHLQNLQKVKIVQLETRDFGPATKFVGPYLDLDPDSRIVICDDDLIYGPKTIATYLKHLQNPTLQNAVICLRGWKWDGRRIGKTVRGKQLGGQNCQSVDVVTGCGSVCLTPKMLGPQFMQNFANLPEYSRLVDDIVLSGELARNGIPRFVVSGTACHVARGLSVDGLYSNYNYNNKNNKKMLKFYEKYFHS